MLGETWQIGLGGWVVGGVVGVVVVGGVVGVVVGEGADGAVVEGGVVVPAEPDDGAVVEGAPVAGGGGADGAVVAGDFAGAVAGFAAACPDWRGAVVGAAMSMVGLVECPEGARATSTPWKAPPTASPTSKLMAAPPTTIPRTAHRRLSPPSEATPPATRLRASSWRSNPRSTSRLRPIVWSARRVALARDAVSLRPTAAPVAVARANQPRHLRCAASG